MKVNIRICGIPAIAHIVSYTPGDPGCINGPPDDCHPPEPEEADYRIYDQRGYPAPWLIDKAEREGVDLDAMAVDVARKTLKRSYV